MPGAPNRPPEIAAPPPPPAAELAGRKVLRRLAPSHVALLSDTWRGAVPPEVYDPFARAETAYRAGDLPAATNALDQLSIRFAEPRWPTLAEPFRRLRVPIPAPVPPHWDPDFGAAAPEKEARKARRDAEEQLLLAEGCAAWAAAHAVAVEGLSDRIAAAKAALAAPGVAPEFYAAVDGIWEALLAQLPRPKVAGRPAAPPPTDEA
jgi:hypothetical protein